MTQLPFGGFDADEEPIDPRSPAGPLLERVADLLEATGRLPPSEARWLAGAIRAGAVIPAKLPGAPGVPGPRRVDAVLLAARKIAERVPGWDGKTYFAWAIKDAMKEMHLDVDISTFRGWVREYKNAKAQGQAEIDTALGDESLEAAQALFQTCAAKGVEPSKALRAVTFFLHDNGLPVDEEQLLMLREMAYGLGT
jgi:hypothetical protein